MFDNDLMFRVASDGNLTASATLTKTIAKGPIPGKYSVKVIVPSQSGTTPTLDIQVWDGDNRILNTSPQLTNGSTYPAVIDLPVPHFKTTSLKLRFILGGTTPNFGAVIAGIVPNTGYRSG